MLSRPRPARRRRLSSCCRWRTVARLSVTTKSQQVGSRIMRSTMREGVSDPSAFRVRLMKQLLRQEGGGRV